MSSLKRLIKLKEKEIEIIRQGCNNPVDDIEEDINCGEDFESQSSLSRGAFLLCSVCRQEYFKLEAELKALKQMNQIWLNKVWDIPWNRVLQGVTNPRDIIINKLKDLEGTKNE